MSKSKKKAKQKKADKESSMRWRTGMLNKKEREAMERYGLDMGDYGFTGGRAAEMRGGRQVKDYDQMREDFSRAASQDYDTRRTLEAAALSGKGKAQDIIDSGFKSPGDIMNAQNFMRKAAKRHGQGGDFSNISDFMGLTNSMVNRDRNQLLDAIEAQAAMQDDSAVAGPTPLEERRQQDQGYEYSTKYATSRGTTDAFNDFLAGGGMADMLSGNAEGAADAFRQQRADNIKEYLKPSPKSQLNKGLDDSGRFEGSSIRDAVVADNVSIARRAPAVNVVNSGFSNRAAGDALFGLFGI